MKPAAEITAIARPVRVAFVIEDGDGVHRLVDAAFSESFGRHGGRQSLLVPIVGGDIAEAYLRWLKVFDPDAAFIVASNNERVARVLEAACSPLLIQAVERYPTGGEHRSLRFQLRDQALSSLSWLPFLRVTSGGLRARPEIILDRYSHWQDDRLITDNFGTLYDSFDRFPLHRELADIVRPLMLTPEDAPPDRWRFGMTGEEVTDGYEALSFLAKAGSTVSLAYLSNMHPKHMTFPLHGWTDSFCLIVGDTFIDRVSCWNAGLLFDHAQNQLYKTLRIPEAVINDAAKIEQIKKFINNNNWINRYGSQPQVTVRSSSLSEAQLKEFAEKIGSKGSWSNYHTERIRTIDDCYPSDENQKTRGLTIRPDHSDVQVPLRHKRESVPVPQPTHLKHGSHVHSIYSNGKWVAEFSVDRTVDHNQFSNLRDMWILPKRNQLTQLFVGNLEARITGGGLLAIPVDKKTDRIEINEPDDEEFFFSLLHATAAYSYPDLRYQKCSEPSYRYSRPSDKGRYLKGVLGMFGSLHRAHEVLTHGFWRRQFVNLGSPSEAQYPRIVSILKKRFIPQGGSYTFEHDEQWEKLAQIMVSQTANLRQPKYTIKLETLIREWSSMLERSIESNTRLERHRTDLLAKAEQELKGSLEALCREGVFHQGYSWACNRCAYRNWTALDELTMTLKCHVCHEGRNTPIDLKFDFRLSDFLATCIREHDTLSLIWALGKLQSQTMCSSFIFAPQTELFRQYPDDENALADREIDIFCIINGKVVVGEVKASVAAISEKELNNLIAVATEVQADLIFIGAINGDARTFNAKVDALRRMAEGSVEVYGALGNRKETDPEWDLP